MADTLKDRLNAANPSEFPARMQEAKIGDILDGLRARLVARTGLTSSTTQVHNAPGAIISVDDGSAAPLAIIGSGAPGAGEVRVTYDADGLATLEFTGAVTAYDVTCQVLPTTHGTDLAAEV